MKREGRGRTGKESLQKGHESGQQKWLREVRGSRALEVMDKKPFSGGEHKTLFSSHRTTGEKTKPEGKAGVVPEKEWKDCKWKEVSQSNICKLLISVSVYMAIFSGVIFCFKILIAISYTQDESGF